MAAMTSILVHRPHAGTAIMTGMMPVSAVVIDLSTTERAALTARARAVSDAHRDVLRARIVLAAADGHPNAVIAAGLGVHVDTVRKWRGRPRHPDSVVRGPLQRHRPPVRLAVHPDRSQRLPCTAASPRPGCAPSLHIWSDLPFGPCRQVKVNASFPERH
ncbi:MAG: helix-turn-helix domain-containing protein [Rhodococcus sp. (in: high G+C Gram-positive bacteria)]|nr:MAG: helix-turn-helix domain-containing protein [Rhodococcus sp. (in: high G+C Gram-positive bacteria)]